MEKLKEIDVNTVSWKSIKKDGLDIEYAVPIPKDTASNIFRELETKLEYFTGDLSKIKVFGKIYPLPRQQVAYGDPGITYTYSGVTVPALPWPAPVLALRDFLVALRGIKYDFVLVNKYRNGNDHMGEHRDNEPELDPTFPIASISLGQERTFVLKHRDARKPGKDKKPIPSGKNLLPFLPKVDDGTFGLELSNSCLDLVSGPDFYVISYGYAGHGCMVKIELEHGSILLMNPPTNEIWYHSLPTRRRLMGARINLTFRKMRLKRQ